jgi:hypothetical protein
MSRDGDLSRPKHVQLRNIVLAPDTINRVTAPPCPIIFSEAAVLSSKKDNFGPNFWHQNCVFYT